MQTDEIKKNRVFVIEQSGQAVHLGGCDNPNQAVRLVNAALREGKIKEPQYTLIVPNNKVIACVPETSIRFAPVVKIPTAPPV